MTPHAQADARQRLFDEWVQALAIAVRQSPARLAVTRYVDGAVTQLLLLESPEPLAFSRDVSIRLPRRQVPRPPRPPVPPFPFPLRAARGRDDVRQAEAEAFLRSLEAVDNRLV